MNWDAAAGVRWSAKLVAPHPAPAYVYVAWGRKSDRPLYVGYTSMRLFRRIAGHLGRSSWADKVTRWDFYAFDSVEDGAAAEIAAINALNPIHNRRRPLPALDDERQREIIARVQNFRKPLEQW